jgi:hypothetical protein
MVSEASLEPRGVQEALRIRSFEALLRSVPQDEEVFGTSATGRARTGPNKAREDGCS